MDRNTYNIDDILEEVRRKKAQQAAASGQQPPSPHAGGQYGALNEPSRHPYPPQEDAGYPARQRYEEPPRPYPAGEYPYGAGEARRAPHAPEREGYPREGYPARGAAQEPSRYGREPLGNPPRGAYEPPREGYPPRERYGPSHEDARARYAPAGEAYPAPEAYAPPRGDAARYAPTREGYPAPEPYEPSYRDGARARYAPGPEGYPAPEPYAPSPYGEGGERCAPAREEGERYQPPRGGYAPARGDYPPPEEGYPPARARPSAGEEYPPARERIAPPREAYPPAQGRYAPPREAYLPARPRDAYEEGEAYPRPQRDPYGAAPGAQAPAAGHPYGGRADPPAAPYYETPSRPAYPSPEAGYAAPQPRYGAPPARKPAAQAVPAGGGRPARRAQPAPPPPPSQPASRRTPKPSMDDLLQNFGEGVGLGKGIDPGRLPIQPRRSAPVVGKPDPQLNLEEGAPAFEPAPQPFAPPAPPPYEPPQAPAAGGQGGFSFNYVQQPTGEFPTPGSPYQPSAAFSGGLGAATQTAAPPEAPPAPPAPAFEPFTGPAEAGAPEAAPAPQAYEAPGQEPLPYEPAQEAYPLDAAPAGAFPYDDPQEGSAPQAEGATRTAGPQETDSLRQMPVGKIPLSPEDTQDDVDYDEAGNVMDIAGSEEERQGILNDIQRVVLGLKVRLLLTSAAFVGLMYLGLAYLLPDVPTPPFMWAQDETMRTFLIINVAVMALTMLVNSPIVGGGLVSFFTLKADNDSLVSLAMIASVAQGVALIITPAAAVIDDGIQLYWCIPVLGLLCNLAGKMMMMRRISLNSDLVCSQEEKLVLRTIKSPDFAREISRGLPTDLPQITYAVKTRFVSGFMQASYAPDYAEGVNRILVLLCLLASIGVGVGVYFTSESIYVCLTVLAALLTVCSPLTSTIVGNLPMLRAAKKLSSSGAVISGYPVVEEYSSVKAVTFKAKELFPPESIVLSGMKVFQESLVEQAIVDACSVICETDSPLAPIFLGMINQDKKLLKPVESIVFEDAMGLSAWVGGKRVLIGNAQLMANHGVTTPSRDYEERYIGSGKDILYLSNSGELIAMFSLSYTADRAVAAQLGELAAAGVSLIVHSTDPNITPARLAALYSYPEHYIKMVPASLHADFDKIIHPRARARATIVFSGTIMNMFRALGVIPHIKSCVTIGMACQLFSILVGYAVVTFFAFFAGLGYLPFYYLLAYQGAWAALSILICALRKI